MAEPFRGYVTVSEARPRGMILLRGDLGAPTLAGALEGEGARVPEQRRITAGEVGAAWMSPDELLLLCETGEARALAERLAGKLAGEHALVEDVSDMRAGFLLRGSAVREVLANLTPADAYGLEIGEMRRSRLGQVAAAFWMTAEDEAHVIGFRSVADYLWLLLCHAARAGSEVDPVG